MVVPVSSDPIVGVCISIDICEVSYPHYIDRVYDTKADPLVVIVMVCCMWL